MKEGNHGFQGGTILPLCQRILIPPLIKPIIEDSHNWLQNSKQQRTSTIREAGQRLARSAWHNFSSGKIPTGRGEADIILRGRGLHVCVETISARTTGNGVIE
eukprot:scaffold10170_cov94-Skeletonema_marinoi.AAC.4